MNMTQTLSGYAAIEYAEANGLALSKYNDPIEDAREGLTPAEARKIAAEDPNLIYLPVRFAGWTEGDGTSTDGYRVEDYFAGGSCAGPDEHGIAPILEAR
jgi:hypothetical protein